jgi:hypothetical protein
MRVIAFVFLIFAWRASGQEAAILPENPQPQIQSQQLSTGGAQQPGTGNISGTVLDTNGDVIQGARVQLSNLGTPGIVQTVDSGATGQFDFSDLVPGTYTVSVSGAGMSKFVSEPIVLSAEQTVTVPKVVLPVSGGSTSVTVMDKSAASLEQVHIAEQQRVLGVFPNFYSSFDWNAPPMVNKDKYRLAARSAVDPVTFVVIGGVSGAEQYKNVFPSFGGGIEGYGKRYGAAYANHVTAELFTRAVFPSIFHDDPRYFIMGKGSIRARTLHAIASTFMTRGDNGSRKLNYSEVLGSVSAAALSNAYFPAQERGANLVLINGLGGLGGNMVDNLIREFILGRLTTRVGKHH